MRPQWVVDNWPEIWQLSLTHMNLAWPPLVLSVLIALPIGWWAHQARWGRDLIVSIAALLYTIPSLVLFVLMPLVLGTSIISPLNVVVALTIYGIALQVRTTADAFDGVDKLQLETAEALGYSRLQRALTVALPLAGPVILGGARVVSASTISLISVGSLIGVRSLGTLFTTGFLRAFPTEIMVGIVGTVVIAMLFDVILVALGRLLMPWEAADELHR